MTIDTLLTIVEKASQAEKASQKGAKCELPCIGVRGYLTYGPSPWAYRTRLGRADPLCATKGQLQGPASGRRGLGNHDSILWATQLSAHVKVPTRFTLKYGVSYFLVSSSIDRYRAPSR